MFLFFIFFFKQKTAYEMRISDWSSDVCSSDLPCACLRQRRRILTEVLTKRPALLAYTLGALFFLNTMNFVDRLLFSVVQELIKTDLALSDFQLGLLGGPAFALLYTTITFPIARLAEPHNRIPILSLPFSP